MEGSSNFLANRYYEEIKHFVMNSQIVSLYEIQMKFQVGYVTAARIIDRLEAEGIIDSYETCMPRKVLMRCKDDDSV
ncbi:DNA translocase FtsK [Bacillus sp. NPDC077411]|uniref:DNA translocase FtsK n=1 Tax=Bacillus sp. NPDC077411 TaxID=3363947 RepID=UPI0037C73FA2